MQHIKFIAKQLTLITLLSASGHLTADQNTGVFKSVDKYGNVTYSDTPRDKQAQKLDLPPVNTQPATRVQIKQPNEESDKTTEKYRISITNPQHDSTIPTGQQTVSVSAKLEPGLRPGHRLQFLFNGKAHGKASRRSSIQLSELYRGSHTLAVKIIDKQGKALQQSAGTTIHVKRHHIPPRGPVQIHN